MHNVSQAEKCTSDQPLVSILIPCFNHERYIRECIESAIAQDYSNIELIIIDDGSSDDSSRIIEQLVPACRERFVRFEFRSRPNKGISATSNEALQWLAGKYFTALDSDDVLLPEKVSRLVPVIEAEPRLGGVFSGFEYVNEQGTTYNQQSVQVRYYSFDEIILHKHTFNTPGNFLRTDAVRQIGGFKNSISIQDWYMWLKLSEAGWQLKTVPDVLVKYRKHQHSITNNISKMFDGRKQTLSYFSSQPLYSLALAKVYVWAAIDYSPISKIQAARHLLNAIACSPKILLTHYFAKGLLCTLSPGLLLRRSGRLGS